jgi:dTDP-4-dehydrorhamnose 3,5-epimerase
VNMGFTKGDIEGISIVALKRNIDDRGYLVETFRSDTLPENVMPQMSYLSVTEPGIARGPHEHRDQTDVFSFLGPGNFKIYLWDNRRGSKTFGKRMVFFGGADNPITVIVPPGVVHGYRNASRTERGTVLNYPDRLYAGKAKREPVDEIRHEIAGDPFFEDFIQV